MWKEMKSSPGADVRLNGCHSQREMAGMLMKAYWPGR